MTSITKVLKFIYIEININLIIIPLQIICFSPLAAFKIFYLPLILHSFTVIHEGMVSCLLTCLLFYVSVITWHLLFWKILSYCLFGYCLSFILSKWNSIEYLLCVLIVSPYLLTILYYSCVCLLMFHTLISLDLLSNSLTFSKVYLSLLIEFCVSIIIYFTAKLCFGSLANMSIHFLKTFNPHFISFYIFKHFM